MAEVEVKIENPIEPEPIESENIEKTIEKVVDEKTDELKENILLLEMQKIVTEITTFLNTFKTEIKTDILEIKESVSNIEYMETEEIELTPEPIEPVETVIDITEDELKEDVKQKIITEKQKNNITLFGVIIAGIIIMLFAFGFKSSEMNEALDEDTKGGAYYV